jgi:hypothetical protein
MANPYSTNQVVYIFQSLYGDDAALAMQEAYANGLLNPVGGDEAGNLFFDPYAIESYVEEPLPKDHGDGRGFRLSGLDDYEAASPEATFSAITDYVDAKLSGYEPVDTTARQDKGQKMLDEMLSFAKQHLGDFHDDVAEQAANYYLEQGADPETAVFQGAEYAAGMSKAVFEQHKDGLTSETGMPPARSYDEVVDRWGGREAQESPREGQRVPPGTTQDDVINAYQIAYGDGRENEIGDIEVG